MLLNSCLDRGIDPPLPPPVLPPLPEVGVLYNVAGIQGEWGDSGDGGSALKATLVRPVDMSVTLEGEILVVDWGADRIRRVASDGVIHGFVGTGSDGDGTSGPGALVDVFRPADIKLGPDMSWYVTTLQHAKIKKFTGTNLECAIVAGTSRGYSGDNGPANLARLSRPSRMVFDSQGNMFFVDEGNARIRQIDGQTNVITTLAGGTWGSADGVGDSAQFYFRGDWSIHGGSPPGAGIDASPDHDYLYVADYGNHKIRRIEVESRRVLTIAGTGTGGYTGDGGPLLPRR
jgi:DNA-binding beta-propeller fold protein YncE